MTSSQGQNAGISRRRMLTGAATVGVAVSAGAALAACGADGTDNGTDAPTGPVTVPAAQVPLGSAAIVGRVVVSQPTEGTFRAFSAICTHEQCLISRVQGATVICTCHQSTFSTTDGTVVSGPARRPLPTRTVAVSGDNLVVT